MVPRTSEDVHRSATGYVARIMPDRSVQLRRRTTTSLRFTSTWVVTNVNTSSTTFCSRPLAASNLDAAEEPKGTMETEAQSRDPTRSRIESVIEIDVLWSASMASRTVIVVHISRVCIFTLVCHVQSPFISVLITITK